MYNGINLYCLSLINKTYSLQAHMHLSAIEMYITGVKMMQQTCSPALGKVMVELCTFFTLYGIVQESGDFLEVSVHTVNIIHFRELELLCFSLI